MQITINTRKIGRNSNISLTVDQSDTIETVMQKLIDADESFFECTNLLYGKTILNRANTIEYYNIQDGAILVIKPDKLHNVEYIPILLTSKFISI